MNLLYEKGIRVSIINTKHPIFTELLHYQELTTWYSSCREGLFHYLPYIMEYPDSPKHIISFDNDDSIAIRAAEICKGSNITVSKGAAHCVCTSAQLDATKKIINVEVYDGECLLVFPPEALYFQDSLTRNTHMFSRRSRIYFTHTPEEFKYWLLTKKIDVNAMHTLLCVHAYLEGYNKGMSTKEIATHCFAEVISVDEVYPMIERIHKTLFKRYLDGNAEEYGDDWELHTEWKTLSSGYIYQKLKLLAGVLISVVPTVRQS